MLEVNSELSKKSKKMMAGEPEFFKVKVANDVELDGWMIKPPDFDPAKKYPVLAYVYGEPAGATVRDQWGGPRSLFHPPPRFRSTHAGPSRFLTWRPVPSRHLA